MPMMRFVSNIGYVIVSVVGGYLATKEKLVLVIFKHLFNIQVSLLNQ